MIYIHIYISSKNSNFQANADNAKENRLKCKANIT